MNLFLDYTFTNVLLGTSLIGITAGILGVFATLRGHSLLGDTISHAAFPGIACIYLLTLSKNPVLLLFGGSLSGALGVYIVQQIIFHTRLKKDAALGIVLSVFFGFGLVLMTIIQKLPVASQSILTRFLYGNTTSLFSEDVIAISFIACVIIALIISFNKELSLVSFDPLYAQINGYSVQRYDFLLMFLLLLTVLIGLQALGVILISALLVAPCAAARQWTYRIKPLCILAAFFGGMSCIFGSIISSFYERMPTGPIIVIVLCSIVFFSLVCAPRRGFFGEY